MGCIHNQNRSFNYEFWSSKIGKERKHTNKRFIKKIKKLEESQRIHLVLTSQQLQLTLSASDIQKVTMRNYHLGHSWLGRRNDMKHLAIF